MKSMKDVYSGNRQSIIQSDNYFDKIFSSINGGLEKDLVE